MSIRVTLADDAPEVPQGQENRTKIKVTLPLSAVEPPPPRRESIPARVLAFWFSEDRTPPPWRLESSEDRQSREQAERDGCWTG
jgi:hypothetical protein